MIFAVIDNLKQSSPRRFRSDLKANVQAADSGPILLPPDLALTWKALLSTRSDPRRGCCEPWLTLLHVDIDLRVEGPISGEVLIGASLPKLLFGHNGCLIRDQLQIQEAMTLLWNLADQVLAPGPRTGEFKRIDPVWHLPISPQKLLKILRNARHPLVRLEKVEHNTTITFGGTELRILAYDKKRKQRSGTDWTQTRVEIQILTGRKLAQLYGQESIREPHFKKSYRVYRDILCLFDTRQIALSPAFSNDALIAWCLHNGWQAPGGEDVLDWWGLAKASETVAKRRRQIERISYSHHAFRFADLLPESGPPEATDILPRPHRKST